MSAIEQTQGTTVVLTSSGGDKVFTLTSLADGTGRQSEYIDLGATFPERVRVELLADFNSAPTSGLCLNVYMASSVDGTAFDGECGGGDAPYGPLANCARLRLVGCLVASNTTNPQRASWVVYVPARYVAFVVWNASGQALTATGTDQVLRVTPLIGDVS